MAVLYSLRRYQARIARVAVGLFAFTWLGLAVQPCHAAEPRAPAPSPMAEHAGHPCHDMGGSPPAGSPSEPACPHCPTGHPGVADCSHGTGLGCGAAAAPVLEQRDLTLGKLLLVVPTAWVVLDLGLAVTDDPGPPPRAAPAPPPHVSVQERFCTHLE